MQKTSWINHIKDNIRFISILNILLLSQNTEKTQDQVRLNKIEETSPKPKPRAKITPELILVITVILLMIIIPLLLYTSGCLESTNYYNRGLI